MTLKLGLMHSPKPANRTAIIAANARLPRPVSCVGESPLEFLMRIREARRRIRSNPGGAPTQ